MARTNGVCPDGSRKTKEKIMIRFSYKESDIKIYFNYEFVCREDLLFEGCKLKDENGRRVTKTTIFVDEEQIAEGVSICKPPDNFVKSIGRKLALQDALYVIDDKNFRTIIWSEYRRNCK